MRTDSYYETFSSAIQGARYSAQLNEAVLLFPASIWDLCNSPLNYGETRAGHFELATLKGRSTRKFFHVVVYRLESGRYELTTYIL